MTEDAAHHSAFTDTCVLFDYTANRRESARKLFEQQEQVNKVASRRVRREFESVATRREDIHQELLKIATSGDLQSFEVSSSDRRPNDRSYLISLYNKLLGFDDEVEVVRRVNELTNRLEKANVELFGQGGLVLILDVDGLNAQLSGSLRGVVDNQADIRILCDAVAWCRSGGTGVFLSEDVDDILGSGESTDEERTSSMIEEEASDGLPDNFFDFFSDDSRSVPEKINECISQRYDETAVLTILSTSDFLRRLNSEQH